MEAETVVRVRFPRSPGARKSHDLDGFKEYTYSAPAATRVGDVVEVDPSDFNGLPGYAIVTALGRDSYQGPVKPISRIHQFGPGVVERCPHCEMYHFAAPPCPDNQRKRTGTSRKAGTVHVTVEPQLDQAALDELIADIKRQVSQAVTEAVREAADELQVKTKRARWWNLS